MRKLYLLFCGILGLSFVYAQNPIPDPTFATTWSGGKPNSWTDSRDVNQVSPGSDDNYAAEGLKSSTTYPAYITSSSGTGFAVSQQFNYLNLYYKYNSVSGDVMYISVNMRNASHAIVGSGITMVSTSATSFKFVSVPINYTTSNAVECIISVIMNSSQGGVPTVGSYFVIDNLSLTVNPIASITDYSADLANFSIAPNPAKNWVEVTLNHFSDGASLRLFDLTGQIIKTSPLTDIKTQLDLSGLADGLYLLAIEQSGAIDTKKIVIAR